jgi:hypothetical protein
MLIEIAQVFGFAIGLFIFFVIPVYFIYLIIRYFNDIHSIAIRGCDYGNKRRR